MPLNAGFPSLDYLISPEYLHPHFPIPRPFNIKALMLPLHGQIFESAMKTLITLRRLPDITVNHPPFGQTHWFWHIPSPRIHQIKASFLILSKYCLHPPLEGKNKCGVLCSSAAGAFLLSWTGFQGFSPCSFMVGLNCILNRKITKTRQTRKCL